MADDDFSGWAIVEMMGHRRLAGHVAFVQLGGASFLRLDVPGDAGPSATQFYSPGSIYCLTPTTEEVARSAAKLAQPQPVTRWELEGATALSASMPCSGCDDQPCTCYDF